MDKIAAKIFSVFDRNHITESNYTNITILVTFFSFLLNQRMSVIISDSADHIRNCRHRKFEMFFSGIFFLKFDSRSKNSLEILSMSCELFIKKFSHKRALSLVIATYRVEVDFERARMLARDRVNDDLVVLVVRFSVVFVVFRLVEPKMRNSLVVDFDVFARKATHHVVFQIRDFINVITVSPVLGILLD